MERYKDPSLPIEERVADLMSRMTLEEKIMQTDQYSIIGDYTKRNAEERVEEFHWEEFEAALKDKSVVSFGGLFGAVFITLFEGTFGLK